MPIPTKKLSWWAKFKVLVLAARSGDREVRRAAIAIVKPIAFHECELCKPGYFCEELGCVVRKNLPDVANIQELPKWPRT